MSQIIARILARPEDQFARIIARLEMQSGHNSADIRLTSRMKQLVHQKYRELGLDPMDTHPRELHYALVHLARTHDKFICKDMGAEDAKTLQDIATKIPDYINQLMPQTAAWVVKPAVLKVVLKQLMPKKTTKVLGYRSIDSMLKREDAGEVIAYSRQLESDSWNKKLDQCLNKLTPHDFTDATVRVVCISDKKWKSLSGEGVKFQYGIDVSVLSGQVLLAPLPTQLRDGMGLALVLLTLRAINSIQETTVLLKCRQSSGNFASYMQHHVQGYSPATADLSGLAVRWKDMYRLLAAEARQLAGEFEPLVSEEEFVYQSPETLLGHREPALLFWNDTIGVVHHDGEQVVSLNLLDVLLASINNLEASTRTIGHAQDALHTELVRAYLLGSQDTTRMAKILQELTD